MALSTSTLIEIRDAAITAAKNAMLGKDVMFEGQRVTIDSAPALLAIAERYQKMIDAASGNGMMKRNVGIIKRS